MNSENLRHLVSFLARYQRELNDLRFKIFAEEDAEKCKEMVVMNWPIIQGMKNQMDLKKIGELEIDYDKVGLAVKEILDEQGT